MPSLWDKSLAHDLSRHLPVEVLSTYGGFDACVRRGVLVWLQMLRFLPRWPLARGKLAVTIKTLERDR